MTKTVIVSNEILGPTKNGGIGSFTAHFARLLKRHTDNEVILIYSGPPGVPRSQWIDFYEQDHIKVIEAPPQAYPGVDTLGHDWFIQTSESAAAAIPADADIVYFHENNANGFYPVRVRRFASVKYPIYVTIMHGSSDWIREAMEQLPNQLHSLSGTFAERYQIENSDFVISLSHYLVRWCQEHGWDLPSDRLRVLGGPFLPPASLSTQAPIPAERFQRIIFFGRLERRKGFDLFIDALLALRERSQANETHPFRHIKEIVLLGREGYQRFGTLANAVERLQLGGLNVIPMTKLDTFQAQVYLAEHATDSLVVMPSLIDNHPYAVLEATLIPGLNIICSNAGGGPEILGTDGTDQLFPPHLDPFVEKIESWLQRGPKSDSELAKYDWAGANQNWLRFHDEATHYAAAVKSSANRHAAAGMPTATPDVDVCVVINEAVGYLPALLESLTQQTSQSFNVVVVNNASDPAATKEPFQRVEQTYQRHGWRFITVDERVSAEEATNLAVRFGHAAYVLFLDPNDIAAPTLVQRFWEGAQVSGDDYLTSYQYAFEGNSLYMPIQTSGTNLIRSARYIYLPLGNAPDIGLLWNCFGPSINCLVRRSAFEAIDGFIPNPKRYAESRLANSYILPLRLSLKGFQADVIPEFLIYHRHFPESVDPFTLSFQIQHETQSAIRQHLRQIGLEDLASVAYGVVARSNAVASGGSLSLDAIQTMLHSSNWLADHIPYRIILQSLAYKVKKGWDSLLSNGAN